MCVFGQSSVSAMCVQAGTSRDEVASETTKWRSKCAELEAAAAKVKVTTSPHHQLCEVSIET